MSLEQSPTQVTPPRSAATARRWVLPAGATLLALIALAALYSTASLDRYDRATAEPPPPLAATLYSTYVDEAGSDGHFWRWMGYSAGLKVSGEGRVWIGVRAQSLRRQRVMRMRSRAGHLATTQVTTRPRPVLLGPFELPRDRELNVETAPGPGVASARDNRMLSVFLSNPRVGTEPAAALPSVGFYATEFAATKVFNWLRSRGTIDVVTRPETTRAWIRFSGQSIDRPRVLEFRGSGVTHRVTVPADRTQRVTVGPFALEEGRTRVTVESKEPPRAYGADPRPLSVRFDTLTATLKAPSR